MNQSDNMTFALLPKLLYFDTWRKTPRPIPHPGLLTIQVVSACTPGGQWEMRAGIQKAQLFLEIIRRRKNHVKRAVRYFQAIGAKRTLAKVRSNVLAYQSQSLDTVAAITGVVKEIDGRNGFSLGSTVAGYRTSHPLYADFIVLHPDQVTEVPNGVQPEDAATAYYYALALEVFNRLQKDIATSQPIIVCGNTLACEFLKRFMTDSRKEYEFFPEPNSKLQSYLSSFIEKGGVAVIGNRKWFLAVKGQLDRRTIYPVGLNADDVLSGEWEELKGQWIGLPHSAIHNLNIFSRLPLKLPSYLNSKGLGAALLDMKKRHWIPSDFLKPHNVDEVTEGSRVPLKVAYSLRTWNENSHTSTVVRRVKPKISGNGASLRVGFIGLGMWARGNLIPFLLRDPRVHLVMGADQDPVRLQQAADLFNIPIVSSDPKEVISSDEVNAVFISTWHDSHAKLAEQAIRSGKKVFVEKPLALNYGQLRMLISAVEEVPSSFLAVGYNRVHSDVTKIIRRELAKQVGPITLTAIVREPTVPATHYYYWPHQGPRIVSNGCHWIDYAFHLLLPRIPSDVRVIPALGGDDESNNTIVMRYTDGSLATSVFSNRGESLIGGDEHIDIKCNGTQFEIRDFKTCTRYQEGRLKEIWHGKADRGWEQEMREVIQGMLLGQPPRSYTEIFTSAMLTLEARESYESFGETRKLTCDYLCGRMVAVHV